MQRDVECGLCTVVADDSRLDLCEQVLEVVERTPEHDVAQRAGQARLGGGQRLAGHPPHLGRLAEPAVAVVRDQLDDVVSTVVVERSA